MDVDIVGVSQRRLQHSGSDTPPGHHSKEALLLRNIPELLKSADIFDWQDKMHLVLVDSVYGWYDLDYLPILKSTTVAKL